MILSELRDLAVPIDSVKLKPGNARRHDLDDLKASLEHFGQYRPIVVNRRTGHIVKGNGTWKAAKALGWTEIAVSWVDEDSKSETRMTVVDNKSTEMGWMNDSALLDVLQNHLGGDLEGTGYVPDDVSWLDNTLSKPLNLPPAPANSSDAVQDAKDVYDSNPLRQLVLPLLAAEYDQFQADLIALAEPGENIAGTIRRLVMAA